MRAARYLMAAAAVMTLAACGGMPAHPAGWSADNVRVCEHYRTQRAYVKNLAEPSLADALKVAVWVAADDAQATPGTPLRRDLDAMAAAMQAGGSVYDASRRVFSDCAALGVTFPP